MSIISKVALLSAVSAQAGLPEGFSFDIVLDSESGMLKYDVTMPENTYLGLVYGKGMFGVDMVVFTAAGDGTVSDHWSTNWGVPPEDAQNDYMNTQVQKDGGSYVFTTYRDLVTSDPNEEDYQFDTKEPLEMQWVVNTETAEMKKHTDAGDFILTFGPEGTTAGIEEDSSSYITTSALAVATWAALIM